MKTSSKILSIAVPSLVVGGLLLQSSFGRADDRMAPPPPPAVKAPKPPKPPAPHTTWFADPQMMRSLVRSKLKEARKSISSSKMSPEMRDKVLARLDRVAAIVDRRLATVDFNKLEDLGEQFESMGKELEGAMQGLDQEIEAVLEHALDLKDLRKLQALGNLHLSFDDDDDDDDDNDDDGDSWDFSTPPTPPTPPSPPTPPTPPSPMAGVPSFDLPDDDDFDPAELQLRGDQVARLRAVRTTTDAKVRVAREQLDKLSSELETLLRDPAAAPAQVNALIDRISTLEATIRKARISAWMQSRSLLDARQRQQLGQP